MLEMTPSRHTELPFIGRAFDSGPGQSTQLSYFKNVSHSWKNALKHNQKHDHSAPFQFPLFLSALGYKWYTLFLDRRHWNTW